MIRAELENILLPDEINLSWEEIARKADAHTLVVQLWLDTRAPGAVRYDGQGVTCGSTGIQARLLNQALGANFNSVSENDIYQEVEAVKQFFAGRGTPWYWWLSPFCQPSDMEKHLEASDLVWVGQPLPALCTFLPCVNMPEINPENIVWQAETVEDLKAASHIRWVGFRFPDGVGLDYFDAMADSWLKNDGRARMYLARVGDGPPAAIGALIYGADMPGVYAMATLPEWGRKGLGGAILGRIMQDAAEDGENLIALTASTQGIGLYKKFGFVEMFNYKIYQLG